MTEKKTQLFTKVMKKLWKPNKIGSLLEVLLNKKCESMPGLKLNTPTA